MSTGMIPACAAGLSATTLSAWRDSALSAAEAEQMSAHVAGCPACQGRLAEYEAIAGVLHEQRVSEPDERLWRAVRAEMAGWRAGRRGFPLAFTRSGAWRSLAAVAAVLMVVVGFAKVLQLGSLRRVVATRTPTATEAPPLTLSWQPAPNQGAPTIGGQVSVATAPSDGDTAYACVVSGNPPGQQITIWVTHDRANHWTRAADLPAFGQTADAYILCALTVDATDSRRVALVVYWPGAGKGKPLSAYTFVTTDGGAVWQELASPQPFTIGEMATYQGIVYATRSMPPEPDSLAGDLSASSDGLRTWHSIDRAITAAGQQVSSFWINQGSGEILAEATSQTNPSDMAFLWDTRDGGRTWTQLSGPTLVRGTIVVQTPSASGQPWHICDMYQAPSDNSGNSSNSGYRNHLLCTTDGGLTWLPRPTLNYTYTCLKCSGAPGTPTTETFTMSPIALADDGALLATDEVAQAPFTVPSSGGPPPILTLYRLPAGSSVWQSLGAVPSSQDTQTGGVSYSNVVYCAAPGKGLLWSISTVATLTAVYP